MLFKLPIKSQEINVYVFFVLFSPPSIISPHLQEIFASSSKVSPATLTWSKNLSSFLIDQPFTRSDSTRCGPDSGACVGKTADLCHSDLHVAHAIVIPPASVVYQCPGQDRTGQGLSLPALQPSTQYLKWPLLRFFIYLFAKEASALF